MKSHIECIHHGFVRLIDDTGHLDVYLVQVPDADSEHGFYLADDTQTWDGGLGCGSTEWVPVRDSEVPVDVHSRLGWLL